MSVVPRRTVVLLILSGLLVDPSSGRPSQDGLFNLEDSRRPVYRGIHRYTRQRSQVDTRNKEQLNVEKGTNDGGIICNEGSTSRPKGNCSSLNSDSDMSLNRRWVTVGLLNPVLLQQATGMLNDTDLNNNAFIFPEELIGVLNKTSFNKTHNKLEVSRSVDLKTNQLSFNTDKYSIDDANQNEGDQSNWTLVAMQNISNGENINVLNDTQHFVPNSVFESQDSRNGPANIWPEKEIIFGTNTESLDNLILSHTQSHKDRPIQLVPQNRPPGWSDVPIDKNVILIEDVDPAKLPPPAEPSKPHNYQSSHSLETWHRPQMTMYPVHTVQKPKPLSPSHHSKPSGWVTNIKDKYGTSPGYHDSNKYHTYHTTRPPAHEATTYTWSKPSHSHSTEEPVYIYIKPKPPTAQIPTPKPTYTAIVLETRPEVHAEHHPHYPVHTIGTPLGPTLIFAPTEPAPVKPQHKPPPTIVVIDAITESPDLPVFADAPPSLADTPPVLADSPPPVLAAPPPAGSPDISIVINSSVGSVVGGSSVNTPTSDEEDEYDYTEETQDDDPPPTEMVTSRPSTNGTTSLFNYISMIYSKLSLLGPIAISLWIILFSPLSLLLVGGFGVAAFVLPWAFSRLWFGGISRRRFIITQPRLSETAKSFEKNLRLGIYKEKWS